MFSKEDLRFIEELAQKAGEETLKYYGNVSPTMKANNTPLTDADLAANTIICTALRQRYPDHGLLTEEEEDDRSRLEKEFVWIIDPIDGTKEFIAKNGEFTINIALAQNGKLVAGVVYVPVKRELYSAIANLGAWKDGEPITVSSTDSVELMVATVSRRHHSSEDTSMFRKTIPKGSSLKGCAVADGSVDCYIRKTQFREWDCAAMHCITVAAGGMVTDASGEDIIYNREEPRIHGVVFSNGKIHDHLVELARK